MVALQILVLPVQVRALVGQHFNHRFFNKIGGFFMTNLYKIYDKYISQFPLSSLISSNHLSVSTGL